MRPRTAECVALVTSRPGITRAEVAAAMGCAIKTAGVHLQNAKVDGLVQSDSLGRYAGWYPAAVSMADVQSDRAPVSCIWACAA